MFKVLLSLVLSSAALATGLRAAWVEAHNHERAATLHHLQQDREWYQRRISGLRASIERFEFEARVQDDQELHGGSWEGTE